MHLVPPAENVVSLDEHRARRRPRLAEINPRDFDYRSILKDWAVEEDALRRALDTGPPLPPAA